MWCWWCCHDFDRTPLKLPYKHDNRRNQFQTVGNFCSWSCMKSFSIDKYGITKGGQISGNVILYRKQMFNQIGSITPAPNRFKLKEFGGDMTIEEFRANQTADTEEPKSVNSKAYKDVSIPVITNTKKMDEIKNASLNNNALKLKRAKPLKRNHNNLESALGLIIAPKT